MFPLLGVLFLDHLLQLVLAQLREGLLYRIGFLSAFLSGAEIRFSRSVFLKRRQSRVLCVVYAPPCFLRRSQCFSVRAFFGTLGLWSVPGCYVPFFLLCEVFSSQEATDFSDLSLPHFLLCEASRHEKRWTYWIFPGHICTRLPRETEGANACPQESHLSREGWTDPATCTGTFVTRQISLGEGGWSASRAVWDIPSTALFTGA
jgi:hypothetical protein